MHNNRSQTIIVILMFIFIVTGCGKSHDIMHNLIIQDIVQWRAPESKSIEIAGSASVGQTISPDCNGLCRIDVFIMKTTNTMPTNLYWFVRNSPDSKNNLASGIIPTKELPPRGYASMLFSPLTYNKFTSFYFYLENPDAKPGEGVYAAYSLKNFTHSRLIGNRYENGALKEGNLTIETYCAINQSILEVIIEIKNRLGSSKIFNFVYILILLIIMVGLYINEKR